MNWKNNEEAILRDSRGEDEENHENWEQLFPCPMGALVI